MAEALEVYRSRGRESRTRAEPPNGIGVGEYQLGLVTGGCLGGWVVASDSAESGSTETYVVATAHSARAGDRIRFTSGTHSGAEVGVFSVQSNSIELDVTLRDPPGVGDTFDIIRIVTLKADSSGVLQTGGGGGSVDTELPAAAALGDNTANPTAPAVGGFSHVWDGATWDRTPGNSVDGTLVNLGANNDVSVTSSALPTGAATEATLSTLNGKVTTCDTGAIAGTVTANAGTNLNTSALALESGGNLASVATKLAATGASAQQVQGPSAIGASISTGNLFPCGFKDLFGNGQVPTGIDASGVNVLGVLPLDLTLNIQDFAADGGIYGRIGSTDDTTANSKFIQINSARQVVVDLRREQTVLFAAISASSSGDNAIVAADATRKIKLLSYLFISAGNVNATWKSGAATSLSGALPLIANVGAGLGPATAAGGHLMETAVNQALVLNLSGAVQVSGHISYFLEA